MGSIGFWGMVRIFLRGMAMGMDPTMAFRRPPPPEPDEDAVRASWAAVESDLRKAAAALGVDWRAMEPYLAAAKARDARERGVTPSSSGCSR